MKSNPTGARTQPIRTKATATPQRFTPARAGLLQRTCACGETPGLTGECATCREKRLQRGPAGQSGTTPVPLEQATRAPMNPRLGHDFSDMRVSAAMPETAQTTPIVGRVESRHKKASDRTTNPRISAEVSIPAGGEEDQIIDAPNTVPLISDINGDGGGTGGGGTGGGGTGGGGTVSSCDEPMSMNKVIAGAFQGGLSMDDYYPDLVGRGYWQHGGTGGPFDSGTRVGSNAQLYGTIPSPCRPELFSLAQTVQYTRAIFDGARDPREGVVQDDIAKSGRNASVAPFRLAWLGGGYNISMADPPSVGYGPTTNIEFDRAFVTSLVGPRGRRSTNWSTSIRVVNGSVTRNTIS